MHHKVHHQRKHRIGAAVVHHAEVRRSDRPDAYVRILHRPDQERDDHVGLERRPVLQLSDRAPGARSASLAPCFEKGDVLGVAWGGAMSLGNLLQTQEILLRGDVKDV